MIDQLRGFGLMDASDKGSERIVALGRVSISTVLAYDG
jgi:hypothetical protein